MDSEILKGRRIDFFDEKHPVRVMPEVKILPHLIGYISDVGYGSHEGMGLVPLSWPDIKDWSIFTGTNLHPEEARILRALSFAYISHNGKSKDQNCSAPYFTDETENIKG